MKSPFLYPDSDPLTVTGSHNESYWLMLLVRTEAIQEYKAMYYAAISVEIPALVIGFGLHIHGFVRFWKLTAIHINFLLVTASTYAVLIIGSISRLITILYETRILQLSGLYEAPIPFLAVLRQASYAQAFSLLWLWTIERACATILVEDYEKHSRLYIPILLNAIFIPTSYVTAYAFVTRILNAVNVTAVCFLPNIFFAGLTRWLIGYNERRLSRLVHTIQRHPDDYSLSLRLQLKENIYSLKKIEFGVYLLTFGLVANLSFIAVPIVILTESDQFETLQWLTCAGNVVCALSFLCTSPWLDVAIAIHTGREPAILRKVLGTKCSTKSAPVNIKVMDNYFNQLESQWSDKFNMSVQKF